MQDDGHEASTRKSSPAHAREAQTNRPSRGLPGRAAAVQAWNPEIAHLIDILPRTGVRHIAVFANSRRGASPTTSAVLALAQAHPDLIGPGASKIGFTQSGGLPAAYVADTIAKTRAAPTNLPARSPTSTATNPIAHPPQPAKST